MPDSVTILTTDTTTTDIAGEPKPLTPPGSVTIPEEPVNLGKDMEEVDGVEEGKNLGLPSENTD